MEPVAMEIYIALKHLFQFVAWVGLTIAGIGAAVLLYRILRYRGII